MALDLSFFCCGFLAIRLMMVITYQSPLKSISGSPVSGKLQILSGPVSLGELRVPYGVSGPSVENGLEGRGSDSSGLYPLMKAINTRLIYHKVKGLGEQIWGIRTTQEHRYTDFNYLGLTLQSLGCGGWAATFGLHGFAFWAWGLGLLLYRLIYAVAWRAMYHARKKVPAKAANL